MIVHIKLGVGSGLGLDWSQPVPDWVRYR